MGGRKHEDLEVGYCTLGWNSSLPVTGNGRINFG
jgi:hypothetical protein